MVLLAFRLPMQPPALRVRTGAVQPDDGYGPSARLVIPTVRHFYERQPPTQRQDPEGRVPGSAGDHACGGEYRFEADQGGGTDDTGMNGYRIVCCNMDGGRTSRGRVRH